MKRKYFVLTVDAESDDAWSYPQTVSLNNLSEIPRFQNLCDRYNIFPTYLLTYEYAASTKAASLLRSILNSGRCEIGMHFHAWTTPPFDSPDKDNKVDLKWLQAYQYELPDKLFYKKIETLKNTIRSVFDKSPTSHRGGRWGIDQRTINWLIENEFTIDTSVVPLTSFETSLGTKSKGPVFLNNPIYPYFWKNEKFGKLLEIPVSIYIPRSLINPIYLKIKKANSKITNKLFRKFKYFEMLRPYPKNTSRFYSKFIGNAYNDKHRTVINMMLHSSELALNCSPLTKSIEGYNKVWHLIESIFSEICSYEEIKPLKLSELTNFFCKAVC